MTYNTASEPILTHVLVHYLAHYLVHYLGYDMRHLSD